MEVFYNILLFLAGLGIFIYAMDLMSVNMQNLFGFSLRNKLQKLSNKPIVGSLMGMGGTVALQSSTAMIVLLISFVQIGVLTLAQSLPMVVGINVGASLIFVSLLASAFNLSIIFASLTIIGAFVSLLGKTTKVKAVGNAILAFGLLFLGLYLIGVSMDFLKTLDFVNNLFTSITSPFLLILIGVLLSLLTQSSLATNAILISLCAFGDAGVGLAITSALWISIGSRVGPTSAGILASLGKYRATKCVAMFNLIFNIFTCILFALSTLTGWTDALIGWLANPALVIVIFNIICSIVTALIVLPFNRIFSKILPKIFNGGKFKSDIFEIDENLFAYPDLCIGQFAKQFEVMFESHTANFNLLMQYCLNVEDKGISIKQIESENALFYANIDKVKMNLLKLNFGLSDKQKAKMYFYIDCIGRYHSLADRVQKIISLFPKKPTKQFQGEQIVLVGALLKNVMQLNGIIKAILNDYDETMGNNIEVISNAFEIDEKIAKGKLQLKKSIIKSYTAFGVKQNFTDKFFRLVNQLEQVGEHYSAICFSAYEKETMVQSLQVKESVECEEASGEDGEEGK